MDQSMLIFWYDWIIYLHFNRKYHLNRPQATNGLLCNGIRSILFEKKWHNLKNILIPYEILEWLQINVNVDFNKFIKIDFQFQWIVRLLHSKYTYKWKIVVHSNMVCLQSISNLFAIKSDFLVWIEKSRWNTSPWHVG